MWGSARLATAEYETIAGDVFACLVGVTVFGRALRADIHSAELLNQWVTVLDCGHRRGSFQWRR